MLLVALATCCNGIVHDSRPDDTGDAANVPPDDMGNGGVSNAGTRCFGPCANPPGSGGIRNTGTPPPTSGTGGRAALRDAGTHDGATHMPGDAAADATSSDASPATGGAGNGGKTSASGGVTGGGVTGTGGTGTGGAGTGGSDNHGCSTSEKFCGGVCTQPSPRVGCGLTGCEACALQAPQNGYVTCVNRQCEFDCLSGYTKQGNGCVGSDQGTGGSAGACNVSRCPVCNVVDGPACCTNDGKCGCPAIPYVPSTCTAN